MHRKSLYTFHQVFPENLSLNLLDYLPLSCIVCTHDYEKFAGDLLENYLEI